MAVNIGIDKPEQTVQTQIRPQIVKNMLLKF